MRTCAIAVAAAVFGSVAFGQDGKADPAPLAGPEVAESRPDRLEQGLTLGAMPGMQMGQMRQLPPDDVADLLRRLDSEEIDWRMRLSDRQRDRLTEVRENHQAEIRAHRAQHAERFRTLRKEAGYTVKPRVPDAEVPAEVMDARLALRALYQSGPTAADLQIKLYAELTGAQQDWMDAEITTLVEQRVRERRERQYADELNAQPVDTATFFNDDGTVDLDALPERLRRQLAELDEPQRANRLRRIIERVSRLHPAGSERAKGRPAPAIKTVQVPDPDR